MEEMLGLLEFLSFDSVTFDIQWNDERKSYDFYKF